MHPSRQITIAVENLGKRFNTEWIFRDVSFRFETGTSYVVVGPNGSGKSTLLQVLMGQVPQSFGSIRYYTDKGVHVKDEDIYRRISFAAPYMELIEEFTLKEQIDFHFKLRSPRSGIAVNSLVELLYLTEKENELIANFSSGMKQRVKLGLALYTEADILFLDEPGTNLDTNAMNWYRTSLKKIAGISTIIIASNDPDEYPENPTVINIQRYKKRSVS